MKKLIKYTLASMIALTLVDCTSDFENINTNPAGVSTESLTQMNNHIGGSFTPMFLNVMNVTPAWNFQLQQNLNGDVYSGYMTPPTPFAGNVNNMTYSLVDGWNGFPWSDAYGNVMPFVLDIKNAVENGGDPAGVKFVHLADIIKVTAMHRVSDVYGPIRYSKYDDFATTGEYDSQDVAYATFFAELEEAIEGLKAFEADTQFVPFDMSSLEGDIALWRAFANSVRLRLAIRIAKVDPALAKTQGELSLASDAGLLESDMFINTGFAHPLTVISGSWGDIRMGAEMESILTGYNDGRIEKYFSPAEDEDLAGAYKGIRMGIEIEAKTEYGAHSAIGSVIEGETMQWMSAAEVDFLQAEAALRGWTGAGTAATHYENGVTASFAQHGVADVATYLADNTSTPADFVDALNSDNDIIYASDVKIAYDATGTNEEQLEQIITQKWIAMFPDGQEAWSEFRRTGYPRIFPVMVNNSGGTIDTDIQIRRINFVESERNTNGANVDIAVGYLGGPDTGGTRLWWDVAGSNF
ncbi:RagB/SusD family nutrient uptake outer membrane protein [Flavicella sp.]|uniref:RagB/SusD family nutrient uptake outer membrane protein n=1 Tax=Flavicella sp. TaxID=2957742 RepID=UPI00262E168F|nr:RagB/SusD family nutrient uptake outer membrane protein [Flavicella sp.]MDG1803704.1 RagB/SusD family nutrient uptake outer membrane protein [Flavicella sp.]MDG2279520.1 RagB/SusD family nutrient uptake outer membrane protein [Flavicella sp.]